MTWKDSTRYRHSYLRDIERAGLKALDTVNVASMTKSRKQLISTITMIYQ